MGGKGADRHFAGGINAPAPLAAENDIRRDGMACQIGTDGAGLVTSDIVQIALRGAVIKVEMRRVAKARCQRMAKEQDIAADPVDGLGERFGLCGGCQKGRRHRQKDGQKDGPTESGDKSTVPRRGWGPAADG